MNLDFLYLMDKQTALILSSGLMVFAVLYIYFLAYKDENPILTKMSKSHIGALIIFTTIIFTAPSLIYGSDSPFDYRLNQGAPFSFDFAKFVINFSGPMIQTLIAFAVFFLVLGFAINNSIISKGAYSTLFKSTSLIGIAITLYIAASTLNQQRFNEDLLGALGVIVVFAVFYFIFKTFTRD